MKRYPNTRARCALAAAAAALGVALAAPARADDKKADALLRQVAATTRATKTLQADLEITAQMPGQVPGQNQPPARSTGTVILMRPNYARVVLRDGLYAQTLAATGTTRFTLQQNQFRKSEVKPDGTDIALLWAVPIRYFFTQNTDPFGSAAAAAAALPAGATTRYAGTRTDSGGARFEVVEVRVEKPTAYTLALYIGTDKRLVRSVLTMKQGDQATTLGARLANVKVNQPMTAAAFAYEPPKTAKAYEPPNFEAKLVPLGQKAPAFSLPTPGGGALALADVLKGNKATLVNFWFYG